ncbi:MAG TPA: AI-2E family transporter, partial [Burkholderiales bacterium]|nr:AI-2E family transporter [Burkholderiales bacterium]
KLFAAVLGGVSGLVISVFVGLYMAADPSLYRRGLLRLVPKHYREHAGDILDEMHDALRSWLLGTLALMMIVGTMTAVGLWALGIPLAFALGIIAFFLEFIPYVGPILAAVPAVLIASTVGSREVGVVLLLYWAIQSIEGYLLSPLVFQRSLQIPPMITISAQVVLGTLLGVVGIIFATPLTACFMVLVQRLYVEDALGDKLDRPLKATT